MSLFDGGTHTVSVLQCFTGLIFGVQKGLKAEFSFEEFAPGSNEMT
jgi:hypothetical protein